MKPLGCYTNLLLGSTVWRPQATFKGRLSSASRGRIHAVLYVHMPLCQTRAGLGRDVGSGVKPYTRKASASHLFVRSQTASDDCVVSLNSCRVRGTVAQLHGFSDGRCRYGFPREGLCPGIQRECRTRLALILRACWVSRNKCFCHVELRSHL